MCFEYNNGGGQRQSYFHHDYYVVYTDQWQRVRLLGQSFRHNDQIYTNGEKDRAAETDSFSALGRDEEANKNKGSD